MNIGERLTRDMIDAGITVTLSGASTDPVPVNGWNVVNGRATGVAVFGPYPSHVTATGVRASYKDAFDDDTFSSALALPAGQTYRYTITVGVTS